MRPQVERVGYPRALVETAEPAVEHEDAGPVACDLDLDWALRGRDDPGAARERCPAPQIGEHERNHAEPQGDRPRPHPRGVCGPARPHWEPYVGAVLARKRATESASIPVSTSERKTG